LKTYLGNNIAHLLLHLFLSPHKSLPQVIADTAALEKYRESLLLVTKSHDTADILRRAAQERSLLNGLGDIGSLFLGLGGGVEVEE
jgi:hypothetical protein